MKEIFIPIQGFPDYEVSNFGRVRSSKYKTPRIMSQKPSSNGYNYVHLRKDGKYHHFSVHRLVAETFIPKLEGKEWVNHKDGNKSNNHYMNLEWSTPSENNKHAYDIGLKEVTEKMKQTVIKRNIEGRKPVLKIDPNTDNVICEYPSVTIAAEKENAEAGDIVKCCKGYRIRKVKGFKWRYKGQEDVEYIGRYRKN